MVLKKWSLAQRRFGISHCVPKNAVSGGRSFIFEVSHLSEKCFNLGVLTVRMSTVWCAVALGMVALLGGCLQEQLPPGVVARINGEHITLREVEALLSVSGAGLPVGGVLQEENTDKEPLLQPGRQDQSVEALRSKYGETLSVLISWKLVRQALEQDALGISDEAVQKAEQAVRADYPLDEFEKNLQEEFIDVETWREFLEYRLALLRFQEMVLRPRITVEAAEVEAWYAEHKAAYTFPARVGIVVYTGVSRAQMDVVRKELLEGVEPAPHEQLTEQALHVPLPRLAPQLQKDLKTAGNGKPTTVTETDDGLFQVIVLVDETPARTMDVVQAYGLIEDALIEEKMAPLFDDWLNKATKKAKIEVNPSLLPRKDGA